VSFPKGYSEVVNARNKERKITDKNEFKRDLDP
jgi:hypothetical protein